MQEANGQQLDKSPPTARKDEVVSKLSKSDKESSTNIVKWHPWFLLKGNKRFSWTSFLNTRWKLPLYYPDPDPRYQFGTSYLTAGTRASHTFLEAAKTISFIERSNIFDHYHLLKSHYIQQIIKSSRMMKHLFKSRKDYSSSKLIRTQ